MVVQSNDVYGTRVGEGTFPTRVLDFNLHMNKFLFL